MRSRILLVAALAVCALTSCAPTYTVRKSADPVYGTSGVRLDLNTLEGGCLGCGSIELNIWKFTNASGRATYDLVVDYRSKYDWFFIAPGQSLTLRVDGKLVQLSSAEGSVPYRDVGYAGEVHESAYYPADLDLLRAIANAESVVVRVDGDTVYANRKFSERNFENFQHFLAEYADS